jgi:hypothetical protein
LAKKNNTNKKNNDKNTTTVFIGLNKQYITQERRKGSVTEERIKNYIPKQIYFYVNDENVMTLECFNVETNAV